MKAIMTALLAVASLFVVTVSAEASSLTSGKKVEVKVDAKNIAAEGQALWKKFGGWCAISEWHPAIAKCVESKEGNDEFRTLTLKDGGVIKEKLLGKTDRSYKYAIIESPLPVKNYEAQFSLTPDDDDEDELNIVWAATYDPNGKEPKEVRGIIDGIFKAGMDNIKAGTKK